MPIHPRIYEERMAVGPVMRELYLMRNIRPSFNFAGGLWSGLAYTGTFYVLGRGLEPWTLSHGAGAGDHTKLKPTTKASPIVYPPPDNVIAFDLLSSVALTGTNHEADQPAHLTLKDDTVPEKHNLAVFGGPEGKYCPAGECVRAH
jgi:electron-transferring-flavoprotein dehydrogenase